LRGGWQWRTDGRSARSLSFDNREFERQVPGISVRRTRVMADLRVEKPLFIHHVQYNLLEATQRLGFEGPPEAKVSAIYPEPFVQFAPPGPRQKDLFCPDDLNPCNDVMSLHRYAMNATQLMILLASEHDRDGQKHTS